MTVATKKSSKKNVKAASKKSAKKAAGGNDVERAKTLVTQGKAALAEVKKNPKADVGKGALQVGLIMEGKTPIDEIAKKAKTTDKSVYWYRSFLGRNGVKVPDSVHATA